MRRMCEIQNPTRFCIEPKNIQLVKSFNNIRDIEYSIERCNKKIDTRHPESAIEFPAGMRYEGNDAIFEGVIGDSEKITVLGEMVFEKGQLVKPVKLLAGWTMKNMICDWLEGKDVYDTKGQKIEEFFFKDNGRLYSRKRLNTFSIKSVLQNLPDTQGARKEIENVLGSQDIFPYPKTYELVKLFTKLLTNSTDIIIDFFSGSATTAHAVMQLNAEDKGNRKFIMVQLPEPTNENSEAYKAGYKNICEIGKERIRRAGDKIKAEAGDKAADLDIGFKVFKLDSSNLRKWNPQPDDLVMTLQQATDNFLPDRTEQDVLYEIILKMGLELTCQIEEEQAAGETVYIIGGGALMICLGQNITTAVAEAVVKLHEEYESELWQVVFRDTGFASDMDKTNVKETLKAAGLDEDSFVCV